MSGDRKSEHNLLRNDLNTVYENSIGSCSVTKENNNIQNTSSIKSDLEDTKHDHTRSFSFNIGKSSDTYDQQYVPIVPKQIQIPCIEEIRQRNISRRNVHPVNTYSGENEHW